MVTKTPKTTKARNLKLALVISLNMNLRTRNFGGATSRGFGADAPKTSDSEVYEVILVTYAHVLPWFAWLKTPVRET